MQTDAATRRPGFGSCFAAANRTNKVFHPSFCSEFSVSMLKTDYVSFVRRFRGGAAAVFPLDGITTERNNTSGTQEVASAEIPESVGLRMTHLTLLS